MIQLLMKLWIGVVIARDERCLLRWRRRWNPDGGKESHWICVWCDVLNRENLILFGFILPGLYKPEITAFWFSDI